ncbi:MAG: ABC transporter permease [Phycisphaerae bacterium]|jgi:putative ABC transport system permease protein
MLALAWANLMHHKLRTALSALAVGLGITLMLVSKGLANGSIAEVNDRLQSVNAELVVLPAQDNIIFTNGAPFPGVFERHIARLADEQGPLAANVIPVFFGQVKMAGQQQRVFGVDPAQMKLFLGPRRVLAGKAFDRAPLLAAKVAARNQPTDEIVRAEPLPDEDLADGLELIIDDRLRSAGFADPATGEHRPYALGDEIRLMGRAFRIVGVVEAGVAGRVFAPLQTLREMLNGGDPWSSMFFIQLRPGLDPARAADAFQATLGSEARVELKTEYGRLLHESFAQINTYMTATSGLALVVCFLFILLTMYTMVVERTREIGILKSLGMTRWDLLRLSLHEALIVSGGGVAIGIGLAFAAKWGIGVARPLLTVDLSAGLLLVAVALGVVGGALSAAYPGYRAARLEPAVALSYE